VFAQYVGEDNVLLSLPQEGLMKKLLRYSHLKQRPDITNFSDMVELRRDSQESSRLEEALKGEGYLLANVGVSGLFVVNYQGENYLLATKASRVDRASPDTVAKLLSGYVPAELMYNPAQQMRREIAEEFLPMVNGRIIPGTLDDIALDRPFINVGPSETFNPYSHEYSYSIKKGNDFQLPGMNKGKIIIKDGSKEYALDNNAEFHAAADTNSGQLIFKYNLVLPDYPGLSLNHTEEQLRPGTSLLQAHLHPEGILLLKLDPNLKLTEEAYITLTEAFAPKQNGVSSDGSINLGEYLKIQG